MKIELWGGGLAQCHEIINTTCRDFPAVIIEKDYNADNDTNINLICCVHRNQSRS